MSIAEGLTYLDQGVLVNFNAQGGFSKSVLRGLVSEPTLSRRNISRCEFVTAGLDLDRNLGAALAKQACKRSNNLRLSDRIIFAGAEQSSDAFQIGNGFQLRQRNHRPEQDSGRKVRDTEQEHGCCDIRAVGVAHRNEAVCLNAVSLGCPAQKFSELVGAAHHVSLIKNALSHTAEEARRTVFQNLAAWTQERRVGIYGVTQFDQVILVSTGTMEQQKGATGLAWLKSMNKAELDHGLK
jgi:hypothetical protein